MSITYGGATYDTSSVSSLKSLASAAAGGATGGRDLALAFAMIQMAASKEQYGMVSGGTFNPAKTQAQIEALVAQGSTSDISDSDYNNLGLMDKVRYNNNRIIRERTKLESATDDATKAQINAKIQNYGQTTQTDMVRLEDYMGKYNSWSQGASKALSDGAQMTQSLASSIR